MYFVWNSEGYPLGFHHILIDLGVLLWTQFDQNAKKRGTETSRQYPNTFRGADEVSKMNE